jgi:uncharacterized membrane protein YhfC
MNFLIFSAISGLVLIVFPIAVIKRLRTSWKIPKGLFLKAGLAALAVEVIYAAVLGNGTATWPRVLDMPIYVVAIIMGAVSGLFTELGRFLVLDRFMKTVRDFREGVVFGLGWGGVQTVLYGAIMLLGVIGMYMLSGITDIQTVIPDADTSQVANFIEIQQKSAELMAGNPLLGLAPIFERVSMISIDIAMSLLIIFGLIVGRSSFTWMAVGFRTVVTASVIYLNTINTLAGVACVVAFGIIAFYMTKRLNGDINSLRGVQPAAKTQ